MHRTFVWRFVISLVVGWVFLGGCSEDSASSGGPSVGAPQVIDVVSTRGVSLDVGALVQLVASFPGAGGGVVWSSSAPGVASVDEGGLLRALRDGVAVLRAEVAGGSEGVSVASDVFAELRVVVGDGGGDDGERPSPPEDGSVESVRIVQGDSARVGVGDALALGVEVEVVGDVSRGVVWSSSMSSVADVTSSGVVTAVSVGQTTVRAEAVADSGMSDEIVISVVEDPPEGPVVSGVRIDQGDEVSVSLGGSVQLTVTVDASGGASTSVDWVSGDPGVATVDASGVVMPVAVGSTKITASSTHDPTKRDDITLVVDSLDASWGWRLEGDDYVQLLAMGLDDDDRIVVAGRRRANPRVEYGWDAFIQTYDGSGALEWQHRFDDGLSSMGITSMAIDSQNRIATAGYKEEDGFVRLYAHDGTVEWTNDIPNSAVFDDQVAVDSNDRVIVVGSTPVADSDYDDAIVHVYNPDGSLAWDKQFGTEDRELARAVAVDSQDRIIVAGEREGSSDDDVSITFITVFNPDGAEAWTQVFETDGWGKPFYVGVDGEGQIIVTGWVETATDDFSVPGDVFVRAFHPDGRESWSDQFGTVENESAGPIVATENGEIVTAGATRGALVPGAHEGGIDAYVRTYDTRGALLRMDQFGTELSEGIRAVSQDSSGNIVLAGVGGVEDDSDTPAYGFVIRYPPQQFPPPAR